MHQIHANWLKLDSKKKRVWGVASCLVLLLVVSGGVLWLIQPPFLSQLLGKNHSLAYPTVYVTQHREVASRGGVLEHSVTTTSLYALDGQSGQIQQTMALPDTDTTYYQKISNGINYELLGSEGGTTLLVALDVHSGALIWEDTFARPFPSVLADSTTLYLYETSSGQSASTSLMAINLKHGEQIWAQEFNPVRAMTLADGLLFVQDAGTDDIVAVRATDGHHLWEYDAVRSSVPLSSDLSTLTTATDDGHVFFSYLVSSQTLDQGTGSQPSNQLLLFELDERKGQLLWRDTVPASRSALSVSVAVRNHCLLIETATNHLIVLRASDKSVIWSATLRSSNDSANSTSWVAAGDSVYGFSTTLNPQTFVIQHIMTAWQLTSGKELFQTVLDLAGDFNVTRLNDQILLSSTDAPEAGSVNQQMRPRFNDIEARQAQTGALLWHKHLGQLPLFNDGTAWALSVVETNDASDGYEEGLHGTATFNTPISYQTAADVYSDDYGQTTLYIDGGGTALQAVIYVSLYTLRSRSTLLYALDRQSGALLWQTIPAQLSLPTVPGLTFFPLPTPTDVPRQITSGPDGNLWFTVFPASLVGTKTDQQRGKIERITPSGQISEFPLPRPGMNPGEITRGPDGNLWFVETPMGQGGSSGPPGAIGRITPAGQISEFPLSPPTQSAEKKYAPIPESIAAGADGNLWFTDSLNDEIERITPDGQITTFALPSSLSYPTEIIAGPDSNLWFLADSSNGNRAIASITTAGVGGQTLFSSYPPTSMISGRDGNLWFLDESDRVIGYLNISGSGYVFLLPQLGTGQDLAGGADGNFWVTNDAPQDQIICFTPSTQIIAFDLPDFGGQPYAITPGPHDSLWFTETSGNLTGEIGRILLKR